eukprot:Em0011g839a
MGFSYDITLSLPNPFSECGAIMEFMHYTTVLFLSSTTFKNAVSSPLVIGSFARNFHIGFDPDYEVIKNTWLTSNETLDDRIV